MTTPAPKCAQPTCSRTTLDPTGYCYHHRRSFTGGVMGRGSALPPAPTYTNLFEGEPVRETEVEVDTVVDYYRIGDDYHRLDGPARTVRNAETGETELIEWYVRGEYHREDGPAITGFEDGKKRFEKWIRNGYLDREDGPCFTRWVRGGDEVESEEWRVGGELHRLDGPASSSMFGKYGEREWFVSGMRHRISGPAKEMTGPGSGGSLFGDEYYLLGARKLDFDNLLTSLDLATGDDFRAALENSEFAEVLDPELANRAGIVAALRAGVKTAAGMREVLAGSPAEWVVAYEDGLEESKKSELLSRS